MASAYPVVYIREMSEPAMHDHEAKKAMNARLARVEGQVRAVRRMIGEDEHCEDIAQQLAAARKALDRAFYEMVACMIRQELPAANQARTERAGRVAELLARFG
jgi:DNA-binding FrmR family transcriptional regulator